MTSEQPTASAGDVESRSAASLLGEVIEDSAVMHGAPGVGTMTSYRIAEDVLASDWLADVRREERARVLGEVQRVFDMQCPPMASQNYIPGAWAAHSWWNTVLGGTLARLREARGGAR